MTKKRATVAIVGRPNVGKSSLFNRLVGGRTAIEADIPGTTRDRVSNSVFWSGSSFELIDTAGLFDLKNSAGDDLDDLVKDDIFESIELADLILLVLDYTSDITDLDSQIAGSLRRAKKPVIVVANKCDNLSRLKDIDRFKRLGNWPAIGVSATLKKNLGDLLDLTLDELKKVGNFDYSGQEAEREIPHMAIIGRPNAGKSTLFNTLFGGKKAIVSETPGTTRDSKQVQIGSGDQMMIITDTAGVVRSKKSGRGIEKFSLIRTIKAILESDIVTLTIDATEGITGLDKKIAGYATENGRSLILVFNKVDLLENEEQKNYLIQQAQTEFNFLPYVPLIFVSATSGESVQAIIKQTFKVLKARQETIKEEELVELRDLLNKNMGQLPELKSFLQTGSNPPEFSITTKGRKKWHFSFSRFLENRLRDNFGYLGTPIKINIKD